MKKLAILLALLPFPAHATTSWCAVPVQTNDGFVSLRNGPGTNFTEIARLTPKDPLYLSDTPSPDGRWYYVEQAPRGQSGWIRKTLVSPVECPDG